MSLAQKIAEIDWHSVGENLDCAGFAKVDRLISPEQCQGLNNLYENDDAFRATIDMQRFGFGSGQYRYFCYPLPPIIEQIRQGFYQHLAPIANRWYQCLNSSQQWPSTLESFLCLCDKAGQTRPTPLLLKYGDGDFNRLHQDNYGELFFPIQAVILLSRPGLDFQGGQFVLVEQRPRSQSRAVIVEPQQGDVLFFPVRERPCFDGKRPYRLKMRHGVSEVSFGNRNTLGIIFHDSQ